ncbi:MAG: DAK2 domain-containing protein [Nostocoides sp.]
MPDVITAADARHWAAATRGLLAVHRAAIDRLNVYPVPDGDTGSNLFMTFDGAIEAVASEQATRGTIGQASLAEELSGMSRAMLLSARGNSGVILSQLVRGFADIASEPGVEVIDAPLLARAATRSAERGRASVAHPVEGTILTVASAAATAAQQAADADGDLAEVTRAMLAGAEAALAQTPSQLPALAAAGVVDAGGAGYVLLLDALHRVVLGEAAPTRLTGPGSVGERGRAAQWSSSIPYAGQSGSPDGPPPAAGHANPADGGGADGPAYEVMYLLAESSDDAVASLTGRLDTLGDSLLVVGGPDIWSVHVHVDDVGAAIEAGLEAGRPQRIRVTHFAEQVAARHRDIADVGVVACAAGPGIAALLREGGAVVVDSGPGRRASTGQLLEAARTTHAQTVLLLPNDNDTLMAARAAAAAGRDEGLTVDVIVSRTVVQGLAALAVYDPGVPAGQNAVAMTEAAVATRHGAVTVAARDGLTTAGMCRVGDILGVVDGDFALIGSDLATVADEVLSLLLAGGGELVTLVVGAEAPHGLAAAVTEALAVDHPRLEVVLVDGGQPHYPLLVGVE